ncbi:MAG: hypothetical protein ACTSSA_15915 [Candidatus Freyarchaeota archaeon]
MKENRIDVVRKELLLACLEKYPDLEWAEWERETLGEDNWGFYFEIAKRLEQESLVERQASFTGFQLRLTPEGKAHCERKGWC